MAIEEVVVLPRRVIPQPTPNLYPIGDCGACVLGGLFGLTVPEVYARFRGKVESFSWWEMHKALYQADSEGLADRIVTATPDWPQTTHPATRAWGTPSTMVNLEWFSYIRMAIDAGYYALANVDSTRSGIGGSGPNHWVLLCGTRVVRPEECGVIRQEVLVSCSSRSTPDEEWVWGLEFLRDRGGFNVLLARPA